MTLSIDGPWFAGALLASLVLALLLLAARPADRPTVRNALLLAGMAALVALAVREMAPSMATRWMAGGAVLAVGLVVARLASMLAFRVVLPAARIAPAQIAEDLFTAAAYIAWVVAWMRLSNMDATSVVATSALVTAVVAFAMQDTLGNVLGGVLLQLDRSMQAGDWVRVDDLTGRVTGVRWRYTTLVTTNGERVVVPNAWLLKNRFVVMGTTPVRRWVRISVDLGASPGDVRGVLADCISTARIAHLAHAPAPDVVVLDVAGRSAEYAVRYWLTDPAHADATDSEVRVHALAALSRNGMKLGAPYNEQYYIRDDEAQRRAVEAADLERRLKALSKVKLFGPLTEAERAALAPHLRYAPFVAGDVITRQGAVAHWLYLIISGTADVVVQLPSGAIPVGHLEDGDVFGEMGMLTGEPRSATVTARTDTMCYRLDKEGFESVVRARPDVADAMARLLAGRQADTRDDVSAASMARPTATHGEILGRVRRFFGLAEA